MLTAGSDVELSDAQTAALLNAACGLSAEPLPPPATDPGSPPQGISEGDQQRKQQQGLTDVYAALSSRGALRGFGSVSAAALLPLGLERKEMSPEEQLLVTGLPTSAFAPPRGGTPSDLLLGAGFAALLATASDAAGLDVRIVLGGVFSALLADTIAFRGALAESVTRLFKPGYATTVREHEAGHFLVAYLLGCPIEACLLDVWRAARDPRFSGAAGTVFFDPQLGDAMSGGRITREIIDRYSVVVMAGIAAEAAQNQRAEGGQADETALIQLLASLDNGKTWNIPRIQTQARWAASQALLLLREHGTAYVALCAALQRGESVGQCVVAIERGLDEAYGKAGELPATSRRRELERQAAVSESRGPMEGTSESRAVERAGAVQAAAGGGGRGGGVEGVAAEERQAAIAKRLEEIKEQLAREDETWTG